ncbi:MAG: cyanamide hydratase [Microbacteriaceae bacterium]|nr:cyanamide hydratase [Microbacteriaceae bacterium]
METPSLIAPPTALGALALEVAERYCTPALLNHSIRSYVWAVDYAHRHGIDFDDELLYVAALLHDCGLAPAFDSHTMSFEEAGAHVAWVFGAAAGWEPARRSRVSEIIVRHMWNEVDPAVDAEGHLLEVATSLDISGSNLEDWTPEFRTRVLDLLPRLDLGSEFVSCFQDQSRRKPASAAAGAIRGGIAARIAANRLDD